MFLSSCAYSQNPAGRCSEPPHQRPRALAMCCCLHGEDLDYDKIRRPGPESNRDGRYHPGGRLL
jgi:hypothetical protein